MEAGAIVGLFFFFQFYKNKFFSTSKDVINIIQGPITNEKDTCNKTNATMVLIEMSKHVCGTGRVRKAQLFSWKGTRGGWF